MSIIVAILLFGLLVLIHEFGHFIVAKLSGIGVIEFAIGMGPSIFHVTKGETTYSLKLLPFGGYCMMVGEDKASDSEKAFSKKSVWARIAVVAAGPVFNFVLAFLAALVIVFQYGHDYAVLSDVQDQSPAYEAGLQAGDRITKLNNRKISAYRDVMLYLYAHPGETVTVRYERPTGKSHEHDSAFETKTAVITPVFNETYQSYMLGVVFSGYEKTDGVIEWLRCSAYEVKYCIVSTFDSIGMMFRKQLKVGDAMTGPIGIVSMVGETVAEGQQAGARVLGLVLAEWILLLSSSLGIMNLLPLPALDGGRLLFLLLEVLRGKPIDPEKEGMVHTIGMVLLMGLMVFVLWNDIQKLF